MYIFSGSKVIAEYDNGAAPASPTREYIYSGGALLAKIDSSGSTYYHPDHLSNRLTTDSSGNLVAQMGHYPFGDSWYNSTNDKLQFTTYERDSESDNDYAMARSYVNRLGRFSSPDPLGGSNGNPQSINRYSYALYDPVNLVDPSGMLESVPAGCTPTYPFAGGPAQLSCAPPPSPWTVTGIITGLPLFYRGGRAVIGGVLSEAITKAFEALNNKKCRDLFASDTDPQALLIGLASGNAGAGSIQTGDLGPPENGSVTAATTTPNLGSREIIGNNGQTIHQSLFTGATITINSNPSAPFFGGYPALNSLGLDDATQRAATLIHELGHAANIIDGAGASAIVDDGGAGVPAVLSRINTYAVLNDCFGKQK